MSLFSRATRGTAVVMEMHWVFVRAHDDAAYAAFAAFLVTVVEQCIQHQALPFQFPRTARWSAVAVRRDWTRTTLRPQLLNELIEVHGSSFAGLTPSALAN